MNSRQIAWGLAVLVGLGSWSAGETFAALGGPAWRQSHTDRVPARPAAVSAAGRTAYSQGNVGSRSGWNASNTWYNVPSYGNYAPPPYATSRSAFYQVGPVPAFGGVRSLPGWGGAR